MASRLVSHPEIPASSTINCDPEAADFTLSLTSVAENEVLL